MACLGFEPWGSRMVGADESTELAAPQFALTFVKQFNIIGTLYDPVKVVLSFCRDSNLSDRSYLMIQYI